MGTEQRLTNPLKLFLVFIFVVLGCYAFAGNAQAGGVIQGTVRDAQSGLPISGIFVEAFEVNFGYVSTASVNTTDSSGQYSITVFQNGIYKVFFRRTDASISYVGQWWNGAASFSEATPINVSGGTGMVTIGEINAAMDTSGGGFISGQVTGPNGAGVSNVSISVYDHNQTVESKLGLVSAVTKVDGSYTITAPLPPGMYKIRCNDQNSGNNHMVEYWNDKNSLMTADPLTVTAGGANQADCQLSDGGIISGNVVDAANSPIANAGISLYDYNDKYLGGASTDAAGGYFVKRLPSGNYKVQFRGPSGTNLAYQWYDHQATFNQANGVTVVAGSTTANINGQLIPGGTISGETTTALAD